MSWAKERYDCPLCEKPECRWLSGWECQTKPYDWPLVVIGLAGAAIGSGLTFIFLTRS